MITIHSFDPEVAKQVGANAAVIYSMLKQDNLIWTYKSKAAFSKMFPYLSYKQVTTALNKLEAAGLINLKDSNAETDINLKKH